MSYVAIFCSLEKRKLENYDTGGPSVNEVYKVFWASLVVLNKCKAE